MKKFTEDDIQRDLPPDVMGLIHDIAYMDRRSVKGNIVERAQAILRERSDADLRNQLEQREKFVIDRCADAMCSACEKGDELVIVDPEAAYAGGATSYAYYGHAYKSGFERCSASAIHDLLAKWKELRNTPKPFASGGVVKGETRTLGEIPCCDGMPSVKFELKEAPPLSDSAERTHRKIQELIAVSIKLNSALLALHKRGVQLEDRSCRVCFCEYTPPNPSRESEHEQKCLDAFAALQAFEKLCYGSEVVDKVKSGS